jgi:hypothetical protein
MHAVIYNGVINNALVLVVVVANINDFKVTNTTVG